MQILQSRNRTRINEYRYRPIVNTLQTYFTYRTNPCTDNKLYDPSYHGYARTLLQQQYDQNCIANPLYDIGCPGYATAYLNQQCTINPLYSSSCSGYAEAYYTQQCELDPLYRWNTMNVEHNVKGSS